MTSGVRIPFIQGQKFGYWTVIKLGTTTIYSKRKFICECICGTIRPVIARDLVRGHSTSCGCTQYSTGNEHFNWQGFGEISKTYWTTVNKNAEVRNLKVSVTIQYLNKLYLDQNKKCALSGKELTFGCRSRLRKRVGNASLDRINNNKGYVKGNIRWVDKDVNFAKQSLSDAEFFKLCSDVSKTKREK